VVHGASDSLRDGAAALSDAPYGHGRGRRNLRGRQGATLEPSPGAAARPVRAVRKQTGRGADKTPVVVLVERGGHARSFRMANVTGDELQGVIRRNVAREARIHTDSYPSYKGLAAEFAAHETVNHQIEYVRGEVHTNTAENYFSILKRGIDGVYHHVSEAHLPRYLAEFDFRYNNRSGHGVSDAERTRRALAGAEGKRLTFAM
jgi:transposase-like protein